MQQRTTARRSASRTLRLNEGVAIDLRTRMARESVEDLLRRARLLDPLDQSLLEQHLGNGRSVASIARERGCLPEGLRSRIKRLVARIDSPLYAMVRDRAGMWDGQMRAIAIACVGRGRSMRGAARELGIGIHVVRTRMLEVRGMLVASEARSGVAA